MEETKRVEKPFDGEPTRMASHLKDVGEPTHVASHPAPEDEKKEETQEEKKRHWIVRGFFRLVKLVFFCAFLVAVGMAARTYFPVVEQFDYANYIDKSTYASLVGDHERLKASTVPKKELEDAQTANIVLKKKMLGMVEKKTHNKVVTNYEKIIKGKKTELDTVVQRYQRELQAKNEKIAELRKSAKKGSALEKELDELETKNMRLEAQIAKLRALLKKLSENK